jgi:hypothetical protein
MSSTIEIALSNKRAILEALNPSLLEGATHMDDLESIDLELVFQSRVREELGKPENAMIDPPEFSFLSSAFSATVDSNRLLRHQFESATAKLVFPMKT